MPVPFHRRYEGWDGLLESLSTDSIRRLPKNRQCCNRSVVIKPCPRDLLCHHTLRSAPFAQRSDAVLAVKASYFDELVKNLFLFDSRAGSIPYRDSLRSILFWLPNPVASQFCLR